MAIGYLRQRANIISGQYFTRDSMPMIQLMDKEMMSNMCFLWSAPGGTYTTVKFWTSKTAESVGNHL